MRAIAIAIAIACVAPACSLLVSLDGLGVGVADAGGDVSLEDVPFIDAGSDASVVDAGLDATTFCATQPSVVFCDDFDTVDAAPFAKWSSVVQTNGGSTSLVASDASAPFAAHFHTPSFDGGGFSPQAALIHTFITTATTSMRYAFDVRVDHYPSSGTWSFSPLKPNSAVDSQLYFSLNSASAAYAELITFADGGTYYNAWPLAQRPTPNVWMHVEIDLTLGTPTTVTVYLDNALALTKDTPLDSRITFASPVVSVGITYENPDNDIVIADVDNVVFDFQ